MDWIKEPKTEPEIFINNFMYMAGCDSEHIQKAIQKKFTEGYCYYFATMLKKAFGRGEICWVAPDYHIVWLDTDNRVYDIDGLYSLKEHKTMYLIPEKYLGSFIHDFEHKTNSIITTPRADILNVVKQYCKLCGKEYRTEIEDRI